MDLQREEHVDDVISDERDGAWVAPINVGSEPRILTPPPDKRKIVYLTFCVLGISALAPWVFFTTPSSYWMYKFRDVNATEADPHDKTDLQKSFLSYLSLVATTTVTVCLILNALFCHGIHISYRILGSFGSLLVLFIITTSLVDINTDNSQMMFFVVTLLTVALMNGVSAVFMGGIGGLVGKFPASYISAYAIGQALSGLLAAASRIVTLLIGASDEGSAFVYFLFADVILVIGSCVYVCASRQDFFLHFQYLGLFEESEDDDFLQLKSMRGLLAQKEILSKVWEDAVSGLITLAVTICIIPSLVSLAVSESHIDGTMWSNELFVPVCGFLMYNFGDLFGRIIAGWIQWPGPESRGASLTLSIWRIVFIPLFMLCNLHPRDYLPVLLNSDYYFVAFSTALGLTNGHLCNAVMMNAPRKVGAHHQELVGLIMAAFLGVGTCIGALLSIVAVHYL